MHAERKAIPVTTAADGTATVYSPNITGRITDIIYAKTDFADTVDFAITAETTGRNIWTEANVTAAKAVAPVRAAQVPAGTNSTLTEVPFLLANERIKFAIAEGGDTKSGSFTVVVDGNIS